MMTMFLAMALADVPPEPGYVERCTVEQACGGRAGEACSAWHGGSEDCNPFRAKGWEKACQTRGASAWAEVWCAPAGTAAPAKDPVPPTPRRCDTVPAGAVGIGALMLTIAGFTRRKRIKGLR